MGCNLDERLSFCCCEREQQVLMICAGDLGVRARGPAGALARCERLDAVSSNGDDGLKRQKRVVGTISTLWIVALAGLFAWQAVHYRGIVEMVAEWQYNVLNHYYPGITFLLLCLFFSLPLLVMLVILWRRWRKKAEAERDPAIAVLGHSRRLIRLCKGTAFVAIVVAGVSLLLISLLPLGAGPTRKIDLAAAKRAVVIEGKAMIVGPVDMDALVQFDEQALLFHRRLYFAPVRFRDENGRLPARFFVEVRELAHLRERFVPVMTGVLKEDSLPGDVRRLYQNIRYPIAPRTFMLYFSADQLRWRYYMIAAQMTVVALLFLLAAYLETGRFRRIEKELNARPAS